MIHLHVGSCRLLVKGACAGGERRNLCVELALQNHYLTPRIVEHFARCGSVGYQFLVALFFLAGLDQLLACNGNLALHVGFLALIYLLGGSQLLNLQPGLGGVYQSYLAACFQHLSFVDAECQQGSVLFSINGGFGSLKRACGIILFLFISAGSHHQHHACQCKYLFHCGLIIYRYFDVMSLRVNLKS